MAQDQDIQKISSDNDQVEISNFDLKEPMIYAPNFMHDEIFMHEQENHFLKSIEEIRHIHDPVVREKAFDEYSKTIEQNLDIYRKQDLYFLRSCEKAAKEYQIEPSALNKAKLQFYTEKANASHKELTVVSQYVYQGHKELKESLRRDREKFDSEYKHDREVTRSNLFQNWGQQMVQDPVSFFKGLMQWTLSLGRQAIHSYEAGIKFSHFLDNGIAKLKGRKKEKNLPIQLKNSKDFKSFSNLLSDYSKLRNQNLLSDNFDRFFDKSLSYNKADHLNEKTFSEEYEKRRSSLDKQLKAIGMTRKLPYYNSDEENLQETAVAKTGQEYSNESTVERKFVITKNKEAFADYEPYIDRYQNAILEVVDNEKPDAKNEISLKSLQKLEQEGKIQAKDYQILTSDQIIELREARKAEMQKQTKELSESKTITHSR